MKTMLSSLCRWLAAIVVLALVSGGVEAQNEGVTEPIYDARSLAERYLGFTGDAPIPPLSPALTVGAKGQFWVGRAGDAAPTRINATLQGAAPNVYLWVEEGVSSTGSLASATQQLSSVIMILRRSDNYREPPIVPGIGRLNDPNDLLPLPDADNDPHLFILFTRDLSASGSAIINPLDSLPVEYAPYSNQRELIIVDTAQFPNTPLSDPLYLNTIARGVFDLIMRHNNPDLPAWLADALDWSLLYELQAQQVDNGSLLAFLQAPDTPLIQPESLTSRAQTLGAQQLFLAYLRQRTGDSPYTHLFTAAGAGIAPVDAALSAHSVIDPVTGAPLTARDLFADFVMANAINLPFGDGRYVQALVQLPQGQVSAATHIAPGATLPSLTVNQFGTQVFRYTAARAGSVTIAFDGAETVAILPPDAENVPESVYFTSGAGSRDATLTRTIDLADAHAPIQLEFSVWHDLAADWNYGYVSVSTDDGATWQTLASENTTTDNPRGAAYGAGFTGISSTAEPRPFPILGVVIDGDGVTITSLTTGGAAARAGVLPGDIIVGYEGHEWEEMPSVLGLLANYSPGDTLTLLIQRANERIDVPVVLGAHPTRIIEPQPLWLPQTVDLSAYAGQTILLRFERVALPGYGDGGMAVSGVRIPQIDYRDDGSGEGWTMIGWESTATATTQQWIVQAATGGTPTKYPRVQRLIMPEDGIASGAWQFALDAGESLTITVSGANDDTTQAASFSLSME